MSRDSAPHDTDGFPEYHACLSGDCPHEKQIECFKAIWHDRDEEVKRLQAERDYAFQQLNDLRILRASDVAENKRLREALEKYRSIGAYDPETDAFNDFAAERELTLKKSAANDGEKT